jgi:hypothetical protein
VGIEAIVAVLPIFLKKRAGDNCHIGPPCTQGRKSMRL